MNNRGPIITLLAVAALAVVLLVLNVTTITQTATQATTITPPDAPPAPASVPAPPPESPPEPPAEPLPAPAPEPPPAEAAAQPTYAGRTSGNEATIAIALRDGRVAAYLCDGRRVEAWLQGTITDGRLTVQGANGARAIGSVQGNAIFGTVWVDGKQWPYSAKLASSPAGLYQGSATVNGVPNRFGWILLQDGSQTGLRSGRNGVAQPAPLLDPRAPRGVIVDGIRVDPRRVDGNTQVVAGSPS